MTELSSQQLEAFARFREWYDGAAGRPNETFFIGGLAGTGKSTLARHIIDSFPEKERDGVIVMTPTGKAADVLRKKGLKTACTIHSAIYSPVSPYETRIQDLRNLLASNSLSGIDRLEAEQELGELVTMDPSFMSGGKEFLQKVRLFLLDEFSMVGQRIFDDILAQGIPVLAFGDIGQLPPVKQEKLLLEPDFVLTEIHRQAADNPIVQMAHEVRNTGTIKPGWYGESRVITKSEYDSQLLLDHDQIICYTHDTRRKINRRVRELRGYASQLPVAGEKLVCKKNDYERGFFNGALYTATGDTRQERWGSYLSVNNGIDNIEMIQCYTTHFDEHYEFVPAHKKMSWDELRGVAEFDFGHCITCHAAQGSEWDSVLIVDETNKMGRDGPDFKKKWLYTAITRAAKRVTIYQPWR